MCPSTVASEPMIHGRALVDGQGRIKIECEGIRNMGEAQTKIMKFKSLWAQFVQHSANAMATPDPAGT
eukprot:10398035-Prorocentrum_lima.AAC.1